MENCAKYQKKDDCQKGGYVIYPVLFGLFLGLAVLACANLKTAHKVGRLQKASILMFYISSLSVVALRLLLFADPILQWNMAIYLNVLVTMPTFIYIIVGFS
jgi:hypothetical protein